MVGCACKDVCTRVSARFVCACVSVRLSMYVHRYVSAWYGNRNGQAVFVLPREKINSTPTMSTAAPSHTVRPGYSPPRAVRDALEAWGARSREARAHQNAAWAFLSGNAVFDEGACLVPALPGSVWEQLCSAAAWDGRWAPSPTYPLTRNAW